MSLIEEKIKELEQKVDKDISIWKDSMMLNLLYAKIRKASRIISMVLWLDSTFSSAHESELTIPINPELTPISYRISTGIIIHRDKSKIILALSFCDNQGLDDHTPFYCTHCETIPTGCIKKIINLKIPDELPLLDKKAKKK